MSLLKSVANKIQVPNATPDNYIVPRPYEPPVGVIGVSDFEDGTLTFKTGPCYWIPSSRHAVTTAAARTGNYGLAATFPTESDLGYSSVEVDFYLGGPHLDLWCKYDLFIPANYKHDPNTQGLTSNNKFFHVWSGTYEGPGRDGPSLLLQTNPVVDNQSMGVLTQYSRIDGVPFNTRTWSCSTCSAGKMSDCIQTNDLGHWMTLVIHTKCATLAQRTAQLAATGHYDFDEGDGIFQVWKTNWQGNTTSSLNIQNGGWYATLANSTTPSLGFTRGRILGFANGGFAEATTFYIDNVVFSTESLL